MDFGQFFQGAQTPLGPAPDGFAIVPLQIFLLMANQLPKLPAPMMFATVAAPVWNNGIYERAMACSAN